MKADGPKADFDSAIVPGESGASWIELNQGTAALFEFLAACTKTGVIRPRRPGKVHEHGGQAVLYVAPQGGKIRSLKRNLVACRVVLDCLLQSVCGSYPTVDTGKHSRISLDVDPALLGGEVISLRRIRKKENPLLSVYRWCYVDARLASNEPVLRLARLIGRQIAREQFERRKSRERKLIRQESSKPT
jgi:hypothetical protein